MAQTPKAIRENINMFDYISLKFLMAKPIISQTTNGGNLATFITKSYFFCIKMSYKSTRKINTSTETDRGDKNCSGKALAG